MELKEIYKITSARLRRIKILSSTDNKKTIKHRYEDSYRKCKYVYNTSNGNTKSNALKDSMYFKRRLDRYD